MDDTGAPAHGETRDFLRRDLPMEVCIASVRGRDVTLRLEHPLVYIDGQVEHIRGLTEEDMRAFADVIAAVPVEDHPGYRARINARRAAFLVKLLGMAASDDSRDTVMRLLDIVHYEVLEFLGETDDGA
jgi:hypothetical protein